MRSAKSKTLPPVLNGAANVDGQIMGNQMPTGFHSTEKQTCSFRQYDNRERPSPGVTHPQPWGRSR
jgi:hypothetical protein